MKYLDILHGQYPDWHANAACHPNNGYTPDIWFPESKDGRLRSQGVARAIEICNTCPVKTQCLADAIDNGERFGVRGGVDIEGQARGLKGNDNAA